MSGSEMLAEVWRGDIVECVHRGHAAICDATGELIESWGDPDAVAYPRSSSKMIQALPLVESGAADRFGLTSDRLALSCASHIGAAYHTDRVRAWIAELGLTDAAFRCGPQMPSDPEASTALIKTDQSPCQYHNNCSGKHSGFLTLAKHLGAGPEYVDIDHPVQTAVRSAFEDVTGTESPLWAVDGCSAPNFATSVRAMAAGMATFAAAGAAAGHRDAAMVRLREAMMTHPELVSGNDKACTDLMRACKGQAAIKGGAEGYYVAILPGLKLGVALKVEDGAKRGSELAITAILARLGVLDPNHPAARKYLNAPIRNWRGIETGMVRPGPGLR
ncbi:asparaginase [Loktanella sp. IMCC34160]|uniref:asparaginase n=1 Tax=Loktanella sp. IMCC34160 TaxID=2510646 RepID=UPI00101CCEBD|nr:asparaginase [Loktanella sp. IMCC34160]RYG91542.1 asparaginase [Loktanella sp. IMCC34160]